MKNRKDVIMDNLKSAETAKQAILERIARKIAAHNEKTTISAVRHSAHSSCHASYSHGNRH